MSHRLFLSLSTVLLLTALAGQAALPARAQGAANWPDKPIRLILPYAPGGATDLVGRPWADRLTQELKQQFVIENKGGASGMIGVEAAARSAPDGTTFLLTPNGPLTIVPTMRKTTYDPVKNFDAVGRVGDLVCGFVVHPSVGVKTLKELVEHAKKNPGKVAFGSAGLGTTTQLRLEMLKFRAGIDILHVPYRGSADALNDLLPGTVQMMNEINVLPHVKAGKLILLNINGPARHPEFPDVPTMTEAGYPDSDIPIWYSIWAPAGTPKDIIEKFNAKIVEIAKSDEMQAKMTAISVLVPLPSPAEMTAFRDADTKANAEIIKAANIKLE